MAALAASKAIMAALCLCICQAKSLVSPLRAYNVQNRRVLTRAIKPEVEERGGVEASRLAIPQFQKGSIDRLWSNLAIIEENKEPKVLHAPGDVLGASALVAGTTVGAGVLALPAVTLSSGMLPSSLILGLCWLYMSGTGLLFAEIYLNALVKTASPDQSILTLTKLTLGDTGSKISGAIYVFIHYALLVAYTAQGGAIIGETLNKFIDIPLNLSPGLFGSLLFTTIAGGGLYIGSQKQIENVNNVLVLGVIASFITLVALGTRTMSGENLLHSDFNSVVGAVPTMFVSLVHHNVVPSICNQLEGNVQKVRKVIIGGTLIPFIMFLLWNAVILGTVPFQEGVEIGDPLSILRNDPRIGGPLFSGAISAFSELAILTSFIGFIIGLRDFYVDAFKGLKRNEEVKEVNSDDEPSMAAIFSLLLIPPLIASQLNPQMFFAAIDYAGTYGISLLFGVMPAVMAWNQRYSGKDLLVTYPVLPGGRGTLAAIIGIALGLIALEVAEKLGVV
mmetsp:Transcript_16078/g.24233  ORF Transcript_16078/g.24233 Transcript_16078/m.24233 type:complete len:505 (-) Transcript_16078:20-1534(-)